MSRRRDDELRRALATVLADARCSAMELASLITELDVLGIIETELAKAQHENAMESLLRLRRNLNRAFDLIEAA